MLTSTQQQQQEPSKQKFMYGIVHKSTSNSPSHLAAQLYHVVLEKCRHLVQQGRSVIGQIGIPQPEFSSAKPHSFENMVLVLPWLGLQHIAQTGIRHHTSNQLPMQYSLGGREEGAQEHIAQAGITHHTSNQLPMQYSQGGREEGAMLQQYAPKTAAYLQIGILHFLQNKYTEYIQQIHNEQRRRKINHIGSTYIHTYIHTYRRKGKN